MCFGTDGLRHGLSRALSKLALKESRAAVLVVLSFPLGIGALEVFYAIFFEDPEARGYFVDRSDGEEFLRG